MDGTEQLAVGVDVMRAFTTAAWAFRRGADKIVLAADESEALAIKACHPGWLALKDGAPVSGFFAQPWRRESAPSNLSVAPAGNSTTPSKRGSPTPSVSPDYGSGRAYWALLMANLSVCGRVSPHTGLRLPAPERGQPIFCPHRGDRPGLLALRSPV